MSKRPTAILLQSFSARVTLPVGKSAYPNLSFSGSQHYFSSAMTIEELHNNTELRNAEFPVTRQKKFFAHAGVCPLPLRVAEAVRSYAQQCTLGDQETLLPSFQIRSSRELVGKLLGAAPEEIAFVGPTSLALSYVASGLNFRKGDNILVYMDDYPSNVYPWLALAQKGVQVRLLNTRGLGRIRNIDVLGQVDEQTRLVALASCHYVSGFRLDLEEIGKFLRSKNILFCLDAIQTVGAFPTPAKYVDFLAADAHKWMLGPCAAGILYVRKEVQEKLRPPVYGWHNVQSPNFVAQEEMQFPKDARRYEVGTENLLGLVGLHASVQLLLEVGVENIAADLLKKREWLIPRMQNKGFTVLEGDAPEKNRSGIVSFYHPGKPMRDLFQRLDAKGIVVSLRMDRAGQEYLRISPHFYNTMEELDQLVQQVG
jgi:selenocysteine lyase/cysteine desulfurase